MKKPVVALVLSFSPPLGLFFWLQAVRLLALVFTLVRLFLSPASLAQLSAFFLSSLLLAFYEVLANELLLPTFWQQPDTCCTIRPVPYGLQFL